MFENYEYWRTYESGDSFTSLWLDMLYEYNKVDPITAIAFVDFSKRRFISPQFLLRTPSLFTYLKRIRTE